MQLVFPNHCEHDRKRDTKSTSSAAPVSPKDDSRVAPYIEPEKESTEQAGAKPARRPFSYVPIRESETNVIAAWETLIAEKMPAQYDRLMALLKRNGAYHLPQRFPSERPEDVQSYLDYFDEVIESNGAIFD